MKDYSTDARKERHLEVLRTFAENQSKDILSFLDIIPIGICITDQHGIFVDVNQAYCELYQYRREELIGNSFTMVVPDEWKSRMQELHDHFMGQKYELTGKWDVVDKNGQEKKIISNAAYLPADVTNGPRKMTFVVEAENTPQVLEDLEMTVRLLKKKISAQDVAHQLSSHDLRNNVASILQIVEVLLDKQPTDEQKIWLNHLKQRSGEALNLIKATVDYAKMEQGEYEPEISEFDIIKLVKTELANLSRTIQKKNIEISFHYLDKPLCGEQLSVQGDKFYMERMFHNLLINALEASPEQQKVTISIEHNGFFKINIHNQGVVPFELRETFFDKFATSGKKKGTGLGTYIAKLAVEMHNGSIAYRSSEELGTEITVLFPREILTD